MDWQGYVLIGTGVTLALAAPVLAQAVRERKLSRAGLSNIAQMTDEDMLLHMARLCASLGYRVFRAPASEPVFDLILTDGLGQRRGLVVRHWRKQVDATEVEAAAEAAGHIANAEPMLVSIAGYTYKARAAAGRTGAILWSLPELTAAIGRVRQSSMTYPEPPVIHTGVQAAGQEVAVPLRSVLQPSVHEADEHAPATVAPKRRQRPERMRPGDWQEPGVPPKCPRCNRRMVVRRNADGEYWGCPTFPRCLGTRPRG
jgi:hypothetical protein